MTSSPERTNEIYKCLGEVEAPPDVKELAVKLAAELRPSETIRYAEFTEPHRIKTEFARTVAIVIALSALFAFLFPYGWLLAPIFTLALIPFRFVSRLSPRALWIITDDELISATTMEVIRYRLNDVRYMMRNPFFNGVNVVSENNAVPTKNPMINYARAPQRLMEELIAGVNRARVAAGAPDGDMIYMLPPAQHLKRSPSVIITGLAFGIAYYCLLVLPAATANGASDTASLFSQGMLYGLGGSLLTFGIYALFVTQISSRTSIALMRRDDKKDGRA